MASLTGVNFCVCHARFTAHPTVLLRLCFDPNVAAGGKHPAFWHGHWRPDFPIFVQCLVWGVAGTVFKHVSLQRGNILWRTACRAQG